MSEIHPQKVPRILIAIPTSGADGTERLSGIFRYLSEGHVWNVIFPSSHIELTADFVRKTVDEGLDGVIVASRYDAAIARILTRARLPTIAMHDSWVHRPHVRGCFRFVLTDHIAVGRLAARHFLSLGQFASYGFAGDTECNRWGRARRIGYERVLRQHGMEVAVFTPSHSSLRLIDHDRFARWLEAQPKPLALFAANDRIAVQVTGCCNELGLAVPHDVAILGVDNDEILINSCQPRLSSIVPNFPEAGYAAAQLLADALDGRKTPKATLFAPLKLVERSSTAPRSPSVALIERARAYIDIHATDGLTPADLAARLHVSRSLLDLRFRELKQGSVATAIRTRQLEEVVRLLRETDYTTRQIGKLAGFENERSLKNIFKRVYGMTMTDSRANPLKAGTSRQP